MVPLLGAARPRVQTASPRSVLVSCSGRLAPAPPGFKASSVTSPLKPTALAGHFLGACWLCSGHIYIFKPITVAVGGRFLIVQV